jgi:protoporphyrinogen oxidase
MSSTDVAILGGGMAGFGAAHALHERGIRPRLYEQRARPGGLTSSFVERGFVFDEGVHISFPKNERIKQLFATSAGRYESGNVYCNNYWRGHWIKHPAQVNLHGLPAPLVVDCIRDFVAASQQPHPPVAHYADWLRAAFGETFAREFPMVYTRKYHTTDAANMSTDWLGPRLYRPSLEEVLRGALEHEPLDVFYVNEFRYPSDGGFEGFIRGFYERADVHCDHRVVGIDMQARRLRFAHGGHATFARLISSLPLPELVPLIDGVPERIRAAAARLACTQVVVVNLGIGRVLDVKAQWSYFYDEDVPFARISYRRNLAPAAVPDGCDGIQAEIYFSDKYRPLQGQPDDWIAPTIDSLVRCGVLRGRDDVVHASTLFIPYGNIIFDLERAEAVRTVHDWLRVQGIQVCGRFGLWGYIWTDQAFLSGEKAAARTLGVVEAEEGVLT